LKCKITEVEMNIDNGNLVRAELMSEAMKKSGRYRMVPEIFAEEAEILMEAGQPVDFNGSSPLSKWGARVHFKSLGKDCEGNNRAERRRNAKRSGK
jgi:hypothetical protein